MSKTTLDEIISDLILDLTSEVTWHEVQAGVKAGLAIRDWHNKQMDSVLDMMESKVTTKDMADKSIKRFMDND